jgi:hypothetical protein
MSHSGASFGTLARFTCSVSPSSLSPGPPGPSLSTLLGVEAAEQRVRAPVALVGELFAVGLLADSHPEHLGRAHFDVSGFWGGGMVVNLAAL